MTVELNDWGHQKFVVYPNNNYGPSYFYSHYVILTDLQFWIENWDKLTEWTEEAGGEVTGMVLHLPNDRVVTEFCLKWS